jgi:SOS-response transcriptional repressor LexA
MVLNCSRHERRQARNLQFGVVSPGAYSWNSELPSGRNPFWIRDEALSGLGLHSGDAVSVDTRADPRNGDLVVVEVEVDGDSLRTARRFFAEGDRVRLEAVGESLEVLDLPVHEVIVMGVIAARLRFSADRGDALEEPIS